MTCELGLTGDEIPKVQKVNVWMTKTIDSIHEMSRIILPKEDHDQTG